MHTDFTSSTVLRAAAFSISVLGLAACTDSGDSAAESLDDSAASSSVVAEGAGPDYSTWTSYSGGAHSSQYSGLDQINRENVTELELAWTFPIDAELPSLRFNPIVIDETMYVLGADDELIALDAVSGEQRWSASTGTAVSERGINYWESDDGTDRRLVFQGGGFIQAINADTGEIIASFGDNGRIDTRAALDGVRETPRPLGNNNPGRVYRDMMIVSLPASGSGYESTPGNVGAWNLLTGELQWVFHAIPQPGEFGADTWPEDAHLDHGGVHNWSELTVDEANGIVFVPFGSPRYDFFGGNREGDNLFGNSLVAIDAATGERIWHQQLVHHDLWDYDLPQAPKLLTLSIEGQTVEAVAQATKQGFLFVFDRHTGEPVWPIEERPVPQSDLPGEYSSPTQPFPVVLEPFADQSFTADDINPFLPEQDQQRLREILAVARNEGVFTPPSFEGSILMPGHNGGANWASAAVDPVRGEFFVVSKNLPVMLRAELTEGDPAVAMIQAAPPPSAAEILERRAAAEAALAAGEVRYEVPYDFLRIDGMTAIRPPWSHLTAYDLNTGETKWRIVNGTTPGPDFPEDSGSHFPRGAPLVTAGGLIFVATAQDRMLRAYNTDTGEELWSYELPDGSEGIPASYEIDGRQYIAISAAAGNGLFPPPGMAPPDGQPAYMVFSLP